MMAIHGLSDESHGTHSNKKTSTQIVVHDAFDREISYRKIALKAFVRCVGFFAALQAIM